MNQFARNHIKDKLQIWNNNPEHPLSKRFDPGVTLNQILFSGRNLTNLYPINEDLFDELIGQKDMTHGEVLERPLLHVWKTIEEGLMDHPKANAIINKTGFGGIQINDVNGRITNIGNDIKGICIDLYLYYYLLFVNQALLAHLVTEEQELYKYPDIDLQQFLNEICARTLHFLDESEWANRYSHSIQYPTFLMPSKKHLDFIYKVTNMQCGFVICHEIGHLIISDKRGNFEESSECLYNMMYNDQNTKGALSQDHIEEFTADKYAVELLCHIGNKTPYLSDSLYICTNLFFYILMFYYKIRDIIDDYEYSDHPPATNRLININKEYDKLADIDKNQKEMHEKAFVYMKSVVDNLKKTG
jgi:hypothetical protein